MFLLPDINLKLRPKLLGLKPGTRIVSNTFTMGDWQPDEKQTVERATAPGARRSSGSCRRRSPAPTSCRRASSTLKQEFQMLSGTLEHDEPHRAVKGKVRGEEFSSPPAAGIPRPRNGKQVELR